VDLPSVNHTPDPNRNSITWSSIWGLQVPPKVRHFLWHTYTKSLPRKKIFTGDIFQLIPSIMSVISLKRMSFHVLWSCRSAMLLWNRFEQFHLFQTAQFTSFNELLRHIFDNLDESHHRTFTVQAWLLWFRRSKGRVENTWDDIASISLRAFIIIQEFKLHHESPPVVALHSPRVR
jgi:hypothetical protein